MGSRSLGEELPNGLWPYMEGQGFGHTAVQQRGSHGTTYSDLSLFLLGALSFHQKPKGKGAIAVVHPSQSLGLKAGWVRDREWI